MLLVIATTLTVSNQAQNGMNPQATSQQAHLQDAFEVFNEVSQQLVDSYRELEHRVVHLDQELACARNDRLRELTEKERVANRLENLLKALPAGVIVLDNDGIVIECNPAAIDLLGSPLLGLAWIDIIQRAFAPRSDDGHDVSLRDGRKVSLSTQSLDGQPGQILLLQDVTETRVLQDSLNRNKRLSDMGEMAATLAHQIRTPLSSALLYSSHLMRGSLEEEKRLRFTGRIRTSLQQLETQVNDMLMFARGGSAGGEQINIDEFLSQLRQSMEILVQESHAHIEIDCPDTEIAILGTHESLLGAFQNMVNNAINAGGEGTHIKLSARQVHHNGLPMVVVAVNDNGPGIPQASLGKIFDPFFTTGSRGTGLGLAVVKAVAHSHNGVVTVESEQGKGSTFNMILPLYTSNTEKLNIKNAHQCA